MDYFKAAPTEAIDRDCAICKVMVCAHEPVFMAVDTADDTGVYVHVEHENCHKAVEKARATLLLQCAREATAEGMHERALRWELRARRTLDALQPQRTAAA